jgi:signal transduction histidine kinase
LVIARGKGRAVHSRSLAAAQPLHQTMSRLAAGVRGALAVIAIPVALLGAAPPVSAGWLATALTGVVAWTVFYAYVSLTRGLIAWLIALDVLVASGLCLAMDRLVAPAAIPGISSWVSNVASLTVICGQFAGTPLLSVPAGLAVAVSFAVGSTLAGAPDHGQAGATGLVLQTLITAAIIAIGTRIGRTAGASLLRYHESVRVAQVREAERADERHQLRHLHNGPLTTLTMAGLGDLGDRGLTVQRRAAADVAALWGATVESPPAGDTITDHVVPLDERLRRVAAGYQPPLRLTLATPPCLVPAAVADGFAEGVGEALENVVRHAGVRDATVVLRELNGNVVVTVADRGRGFDPDAVPTYRFGLRHGVGGRLADAGGRSRVRSAPGEGTQVTLEWSRG